MRIQKQTETFVKPAAYDENSWMRIASYHADTDEYHQLHSQGLDMAAIRKELASRYTTPEEQAAFKKGWDTSKRGNRKPIENYLSVYDSNPAAESAFSDGWAIVAAVW